MIYCIIDILGDVWEWIEGVIDGASPVPLDGIDWGDLIEGVISTGAIVAGVITVASITKESIRSQMRNRPELRNKGVASAVVKEFIQQNGYTEITLAALNKQNQQIGTFKMKSSCVEGIKKGDKILA